MSDKLRGMPGSIGETALPNTGSRKPGKGHGTGRYKKGKSSHSKRQTMRKR